MYSRELEKTGLAASADKGMYTYREMKTIYEIERLFIKDMRQTIQKTAYILGNMCLNYNIDTRKAMFEIAGIVNMNRRKGGSVEVVRRVPQHQSVEVVDDYTKIIHSFVREINECIDSIPNEYLRQETLKTHRNIAIKLGLAMTTSLNGSPLTMFNRYTAQLNLYGITHILAIRNMTYGSKGAKGAAFVEITFYAE